MRKGFRPLLESPDHRRIGTRARRPILCLTLTLVPVILIITIFGMSAWNVYEHRFGKNTYVFHSGDEVAMSRVAGDFSVTFCDSYEVSLQGSGQAYLLPHQATVNTTFSDEMPVEISQLPYREFNVRYIYLLKKSSVNVTACRNNAPISPDAHIVFIQGENNFKRWQRNAYCIDCILVRKRIPEDAYCNAASRHLPRLYHQVESDDRYFLVIFNGRPGPKHHFINRGISLNGFFLRTHFDLSDSEKTCRIVNSSACLFDLPWMSAKDLVIKCEGQTRSSYHNKLTTHCHTRVVLWVCLFGILPIVFIILIFTFVGCFLLRRTTRKDRKCSKQGRGERKRLLRDEDKQFTNHVLQDEENERMAIQFG